MQSVRLNTNYDLEYYRSKYNECQELVCELQNKSTDLYERMIRLLDENEILRLKIADLENHRAYTVKLQISK